METAQNATSYIEQILEATSHETTAVRLLIFHHMDVPVLADKRELTYNISGRTQRNLENLPGAMDDRDGWGEGEERVNEIAAQFDDDDYIYIYRIYAYI